MAWRDWFKKTERASTTPMQFRPPTLVPGYDPGVGNQPSHERLLRNSVLTADTCAKAIADRTASLKMLVQTPSINDEGMKEWRTVGEHALVRLLENPHPDMGMFEMMRVTIQHLIIVGEAYWLKVRSRGIVAENGLNVPAELHLVPPANVEPIIELGRVKAYGVKDWSGQVRIEPPENVIRFYFPDPEDPWASEGYLGPMGAVSDTVKFAAMHLRAHYMRNATPKSVLEATDTATPFDPDSREAFHAMWEKVYNSITGTAVGGPAILPTGYKLIQMPNDSMEGMSETQSFWRDEILLAYGVPRSVLGQVVSGDRSSAETNQWVFDNHRIKPITILVASALTRQLAKDFSSRLTIRYEDFVSRDKHFDLEQEQKDLELKIRSVNQVRKDRGWDPVPWGDEPIGKTGDRVFDPDEDPLMPGAGQDTPEAAGNDNAQDEEERARAARKRNKRRARNRAKKRNLEVVA